MTSPCRVLVADPPWRFGDSLPGATRGAARNYATLSIEEIERFPLPPLADDAILFLWRVASMPEEALRVVRAWGFVPKTEMVWIKRTKHGLLHFGMGRTLRASHETCVVATRGRFKVASRSVRSVFEAPVGRHSEKPHEFLTLVEELVGFDFAAASSYIDDATPSGEMVELFSRRDRLGWRRYGLESGGEAHP